MPHEGHSHKPDVPHQHPRRRFKASVDHLAGDFASASRLLVAIDQGDLTKLPFSDDIGPDSRLLMRRNVRSRVAALAPLLTFDPDPYLVIGEGGRLFWVMDAFTTSSTYPYARSYRLGSERINYIRNSVKAVVDAYDGTVSLYVFDAEDPVITAYRALFPTLFKDASAMPAALRKHVRYPETQLELQAASLGGAQFMEQLTAAEVDLAALAETIERDGIKLFGLQAEIDRIQREINALGAVNLAALDELTAARERKGFLDSQMADLLDAIQTLEDAIHKIDLETRDLLGATFNTVNEHFGRMFPSLFGGGSAKLVMTGDEILDAGVQVMAHPPGKKNSTIHLLSGGEKALTAIALVFAIFQLNPAPFCLLDEVDAPLDDANTERYARLVKSMSAGTQFLFISHNKIAMEMAEQLVGVTMQEQGVSRIVAVDMEAALGMAHAA